MGCPLFVQVLTDTNHAYHFCKIFNCTQIHDKLRESPFPPSVPPSLRPTLPSSLPFSSPPPYSSPPPLSSLSSPDEVSELVKRRRHLNAGRLQRHVLRDRRFPLGVRTRPGVSELNLQGAPPQQQPVNSDRQRIAVWLDTSQFLYGTRCAVRQMGTAATKLSIILFNFLNCIRPIYISVLGLAYNLRSA